jgi:hypothetical protein
LLGGAQLTDRACDVLDRHSRIDAVLIEEIDHIRFQSLEGSVGDRLDMLGRLSRPMTAWL